MASTLSNRTYFINTLRFWWNATPMASLKLSTFQDALAFYDQNPKFVEDYGALVKTVKQEKVRLAHEKLAKAYQSKYPPKEEFYNFLASEVGSLSFSDVGAAVADTAKDVAGIAKSGIGLYIGVLAAGAALALYSFARKK